MAIFSEPHSPKDLEEAGYDFGYDVYVESLKLGSFRVKKHINIAIQAYHSTCEAGAFREEYFDYTFNEGETVTLRRIYDSIYAEHGVRLVTQRMEALIYGAAIELSVQLYNEGHIDTEALRDLRGMSEQYMTLALRNFLGPETFAKDVKSVPPRNNSRGH